MTCASFENSLALYVERDLSDAAVPAVEAHLVSCAECRRFLDDLRASQSLVKGLAGEPVDADTLVALRARVVAAAAVSAHRSRDRKAGPMLWAVAAALILAATGGVLWIAMGARVTPRGPSVAVGPPPPVTTPAPPAPAAPSARSTGRALPRVSPHMGRAAVAHVRVSVPVDPAAAAPALSSDDADQLARAVVAVSRIRSLQDIRPEADPSPEPTPLMRLATTDPNVVIYWRLDSNGGQ